MYQPCEASGHRSPSQRRDQSEDDGFTLIESLMATALTSLIVAGALTLAASSQAAFQAQPEAADLQERLRGAAGALIRDLTMAGAGFDAGSAAGGLVGAFAPVVPRRLGRRGDPPEEARTDAITITYVPSTLAQGTTSVVVPDAAGLRLEDAATCPAGSAVCGLQSGMTIVVFDRTARHDFFTISSVQGDTAQLRSHAATSVNVFSPGAFVAQVQTRSYYLDAERRQLRAYDGDQTDVPVADNVVGLALEYFGGSRPPASPVPPAGVENCLYDETGRPKPMPWLTGGGDDLVPLPMPMLNDGPWCGEGETRFDADLLRVRAVRVAVRLQAALPEFRALGPDFLQPGSSRTSARYLPDAAISVLVAPRNLGR